MSTETKTKPIKGPSSDQRDEWLARRRHGVTATEVAKAAGGRAADVRAIITEKVTDTNTPDLSGNQYIAFGNTREPVIAEMVRANFGIEPNRFLYAHGDEPRFLATPDGYSDDDFTGERLVSEIKTSKHDLNPFPPDHEQLLTSRVPVLDCAFADRALARGGTYFWTTTYYDQMQWQMYVTGATRCLFAPEQHDNRWPNPTPKPVEPVWVLRNEPRIEKLVKAAMGLLAEIERTAPADIAPASEIDPVLAEHVHGYLKGLADEKVAEGLKTMHKRAAEKFVAGMAPFSVENFEAKISWQPTLSNVTEIDEALLAKATPAQLARIERAQVLLDAALEAQVKAQTKVDVARERLSKARERFAVTRAIGGASRLTITAKKTK